MTSEKEKNPSTCDMGNHGNGARNQSNGMKTGLNFWSSKLIGIVSPVTDFKVGRC